VVTTLRVSYHPLLAAAHLAIDRRTYAWNPQGQSLLTSELPHLGGPQPTVPRSAQAEIVYWCAETVAPLVITKRREHLIDLLREVRAPSFASASDTMREEVLASLRVLDPTGGYFMSEDHSPLRLAGLVAIAAARTTPKWRNAPRTALRAITWTARILTRMRDQGAMAPEAFPDALDDKLMRAEWMAFADRTMTSRRLYGNAGARLETLVYRGGDEKGDGVVWVASLESTAGPTWGVLVRRRGFHFAEGAPGEALAIVPDEYFESAGAAVFRAIGARGR